PQSETNFIPSAFVAANAPAVNASGTITPGPTFNPLNGLVLNGPNGFPNNFSNNHVWYAGPLIGFAWDIFGDGKTSLRGGYGITYTRIFTNQDCSFNCIANPPVFSNQNLSNLVLPSTTGWNV